MGGLDQGMGRRAAWRQLKGRLGRPGKTCGHARQAGGGCHRNSGDRGAQDRRGRRTAKGTGLRVELIVGMVVQAEAMTDHRQQQHRHEQPRPQAQQESNTISHGEPPVNETPFSVRSIAGTIFRGKRFPVGETRRLAPPRGNGGRLTPKTSAIATERKNRVDID